MDLYAAGWRSAAMWARREDLLADIGSPMYESERRAATAPRNADGQMNLIEPAAIPAEICTLLDGKVAAWVTTCPHCIRELHIALASERR